jgi:molybdopterin-synthase adenylyltransferase
VLEEADIQRFARQILVKEIGGHGQDRLLRATVELVGPPGPVLDSAAVWLAAGGSSARGHGSAAGFPLPQASSRRAELAVVLLPGAVPPGPAVVLGQVPGQRGMVVAPLPACQGCRAWVLKTLQPAETPWPELVASLAALAAQRLLLGLSRTPGLRIAPEGILEPWSAPTCAAH